MAAQSKGLTCTFNLRTTDAERQAVERVVRDYAQYGVKISLNDGVRILIRRGSTERPTTLKGLRIAIEQHWHECPYCDEGTVPAGCPDGERLRQAYGLLAATPPPPAPRAASPVQGPAGGPSPRPVTGLQRLKV